jgi:hypothetical protein
MEVIGLGRYTHPMHSLHLLLVFAVIVCSADGQKAEQSPLPPNEDSLHAIHEALFSSFLPIEELKQDSRTLALFTDVGNIIWSAANHAPKFRQLLSPFADLRGFGVSCGIRSYLRPTGLASFASLTRPQRDHVLWLLASCDENEPRHLAMSVRDFYIAKVYDALQEPLSGVRLNLSAPHSWIEEHRPRLPPTRLRFDRESREIISTDAPIDYLIVGSGPAGAVLAHELRRDGKHVTAD